MRRATHHVPRVRRQRHISIHALHEESDEVGDHVVGFLDISIHALHEESDRAIGCSWCVRAYFNPRSP